MASNLANIKPERMAENVRPLIPWEENPAKFHMAMLPTNKSVCTYAESDEAGKTSIAVTEPIGGVSYYTGCSVNMDISAMGAEAYSTKFTAS